MLASRRGVRTQRTICGRRNLSIATPPSRQSGLFEAPCAVSISLGHFEVHFSDDWAWRRPCGGALFVVTAVAKHNVVFVNHRAFLGLDGDTSSKALDRGLVPCWR